MMGPQLTAEALFWAVRTEPLPGPLSPCFSRLADELSSLKTDRKLLHLPPAQQLSKLSISVPLLGDWKMLVSEKKKGVTELLVLDKHPHASRLEARK